MMQRGGSLVVSESPATSGMTNHLPGNGAADQVVLPGQLPQLTQADEDSNRTTEEEGSSSETNAKREAARALHIDRELVQQPGSEPELPELSSLENSWEPAAPLNDTGWIQTEVAATQIPLSHVQETTAASKVLQRNRNADTKAIDKIEPDSDVEDPPKLWERMVACVQAALRVLESLMNVGKTVTTLRPNKSILINDQMKFAREKQRRNPRGRPKRVHFKLPRKRGLTKKFHAFDPGHVYVERWLIFMVLPLAYELWAFPFRLAFGIPSDVGILLADICCDIFIFIDIVLMFGITIPAYAVVDQPEDITNFRGIAAYRIKHDLPTRAIPAVLFYIVTGATWNAVAENELNQWLWLWWGLGMVPRMLVRLWRLVKYFRDIETNLEVSVRSLQLVKFALIIFLSAHWVGCIFFCLSRLNGFNEETWVRELEDVLPLYYADRSPRDLRYLLCVYKGFSAMVNLNYGLGLPRSLAEMVWSMFTMALQIYMNALILGTLLNFLVQKDPVQEAYKKRLEDLTVFMDAKQLPLELRERIQKHFHFQHQKNVQNKAAGLLSLPRSLQIKVADAKYKHIIDKCTDKGRTLHGCNAQFISALLTRLQVMHAMAGEEITKRHEIARELYFVLDGAVHVVDDENRIKRAIRSDVPDLSPIVGEVPFFLGINHPHSVKARSDGSVQLLVLTKEASADVFSTYPEEFEIITSNLLQQFDLTDRGEQVGAGGVDRELEQDTLLLKTSIQESMKMRRDRRFTQLLQSAANGDVEAVMLEARQGADINQSNYDGRTILHMAAEEGNYRMVEMLLEQGADKNARDRWGQTPLTEAILNRQSLVAGLLSQWHAELGMDNAASVLCQYAYEGNQEHIIRLVNNNTDPNLKDCDGRTAIHVGAAVGHHKIVEYLLTKKGDPNVADRFGGTPLQDAVLNGQTLCATILRTYGATLKREVGSREIRSAAKKGDVARLRLLHDCGETVEVHDYDHRYPLHLATADAKLVTVSYLLGISADPNVQDRWGGRPLDDALKGWTPYHKYCAKLIHGWGGELGTLRGTEEGKRKLQELESISLEQVRTVIKRLIANGHDKQPVKMLSETELRTHLEVSIETVPWVHRLRQSVETASSTLRDTADASASEVDATSCLLAELACALQPPSQQKRATDAQVRVLHGDRPFSPLLMGGEAKRGGARGGERGAESGRAAATSKAAREQTLAGAGLLGVSPALLKEVLQRLEAMESEGPEGDGFVRTATVAGWGGQGEGGIDSEEEEQLHAEIDALLATREAALLAKSSPEEMAGRQFQEAAMHIVQFELAFEALASACLEVRMRELREAGATAHTSPGAGWNGRVTADGLGRLLGMLRAEAGEAGLDPEAMYDEGWAFALAFPLSRGPGHRKWAKVRGGIKTIARMRLASQDEHAADSAMRSTISLEALLAGSSLFRRALEGMKTDQSLCKTMETRLGRVLGEDRTRILLVGSQDCTLKRGEVVLDAVRNEFRALILLSGELSVEQNSAALDDSALRPKHSVLTSGDYIGVARELGERTVPGLRISASRECSAIEFRAEQLKKVCKQDKGVRRQLLSQAGDAPDKADEEDKGVSSGRAGLLARIGDSARELARAASRQKVAKDRKRRSSLGQALHNARNVFRGRHESIESAESGSPAPAGAAQPWELTEEERKWIQKMVVSINSMWTLLSMGQPTVTRGQLLAIRQHLGEVSSECFRKLLAASHEGESHSLPELVDQQLFWRCWVKFLSEEVYGEDLRGKGRSVSRAEGLEAQGEDASRQGKGQAAATAAEEEELSSSLFDRLHNRLDPGRWLKKRFFDEEVVEQYEPAYLAVVGNLKDPLRAAQVPQLLERVFVDLRFRFTEYNVQEFFAAFLSHRRESAKSISWPEMRKALRERRMGNVVGEESKALFIGTAVNPSSPWMLWWYRLIKLTAVAHFLLVPWRATFLPWPSMTHPNALRNDVVLDVVTVLNLIVMLNTAYVNTRSMLVTRRGKIVNKVHWPSGLAAMPLDWLAWLCGASNEACCWLRLNKMLLMLNWSERCWVGFRQVRRKSKSKHSIIYKMIASVLMVLHLAACLWFFLGARYGSWFPSRAVSWLEIEEQLQPEIEGITFDRAQHFAFAQNATTLHQYALSLYWVSATLTVNGLVGDVVPQNWVEVLFTIVIMALNMTLIRWVVGEVSTIVMSAGRGLAEARQELEAVDRFASGSNLPEELQKEIKLHYRASNAQGGIRNIDQESLLQGMSHSLKVEVASFISREYLDGVDLFAGCSERLLDAVSVLLLEVSFAPEEFLFRTAGAAREMFFVVSGCVEELSGSEEMEVDQVRRAHSSVGGIAFFFGLRHLHSARASKLCGATCLRLVRDHFFELLKIYPQDEEVIGSNAMASLEVVQTGANSSRRGAGSVRESVTSAQAEGHAEGEGEREPTADRQQEPEELEIHTMSGQGSEISDGLEALVGSSMKDKITALKSRQRKQRISQLMTACHECDQTKVAAIIQGDLSVNSCDSNRRTALHIAASEGHLPLVKMLLDMRADVRLKDKFENTPFNDAVRHQHDHVVKYIRDTVPGTLMTLPGFKAAVLMCDAAHRGDLATIKRLVGNDVQPNDANYDGRTALHLAACEGHIEVCEYLLERGASPDKQDRFGGTPLCDAVSRGQEEVQQLLRRHGAGLGEGFGDRFVRKVNGAAWAGDVATVKTMVENGVDPEEGDHRRRTALHLAACREKISVMEYLLDLAPPHAFDINRVDRYGNTALDDAIRESSTTAEALLRKRGALHKGDGERWAQLAQEQEDARTNLQKQQRRRRVDELTSYCAERRATEAVEQRLIPGLRTTGQALTTAVTELADRLARAAPLLAPMEAELQAAERRIATRNLQRGPGEAPALDPALQRSRSSADGPRNSPDLRRLTSKGLSTTSRESNPSDMVRSASAGPYVSAQEAAEQVLEQANRVRRLVGDVWRLVEAESGSSEACVSWNRMRARFALEAWGPARQLRRLGETAKLTMKLMKEAAKAARKSAQRRQSMTLRT